MTKGGSYSIQKVLRGEARQKKEGITRFDRRKMHFKHEAEAVHCHDNDPKPQDQPPKRPPPRSTTDDAEGESSKKDDDDSEFDEEELALLAEAEKDPRQMMMLKGASHSIRNIFSGKAKKKDNIGAGMQRRKSQLTAHKAPARPAGMPDSSERESIAQDEEVSVSTRGDDEKGDNRRSRFTLRGASNSIKNVLRRRKKEPAKEEPNPPPTPTEVATQPQPEKQEPSVEASKDDDPDLDDDDADIIEEADKRSNFMAKGGSYSIQKVLRGNARKKTTGVTRFDRRKMHFKKESEAIHSHDHDGDQAKDSKDASPAKAPVGEKEAEREENKPRPEAERVDTDATADNDLDLDDDDADIVEEADRRSKFMSKGGSYSIQKVLKGEARAKKGVSRFDRRKMHFKKEAEAIHSHDGDAAPKTPQPAESQANEPEAGKPQSEMLAALASGAPAKSATSTAANAKMPSRRVSDGMEDDNADAGDEEDTESAEPDRRSRFTLKGASHSIKKVLAGKARAKKDIGVSRLDRRRIQLKSKSTPRGDLPPGK